MRLELHDGASSTVSSGIHGAETSDGRVIDSEESGRSGESFSETLPLSTIFFYFSCVVVLCAFAFRGVSNLVERWSGVVWRAAMRCFSVRRWKPKCPKIIFLLPG